MPSSHSQPRAPSPSDQLTSALSDSIKSSLSTNRPILHHLNADSSWLFQIPKPVSSPEPANKFGFNISPEKSKGREIGERRYFNILIDPWLSGPQSDVAAWFSTQWHASESKVGSVREVEELIWRTEGLRGEGNGREGEEDVVMDSEDDEGENPAVVGKSEGSCIDAVIVSHEFTDHCHKDTLLELDPGVPVFATEKAATLISSWTHFKTVIPVSTLSSFSSSNDSPIDWHKTSLPPLPSWISISRLQDEKDALYYHSGILITFSSSPSPSSTHSAASTSTLSAIQAPLGTQLSSSSAESILYTPHGLPPSALTPLLSASPPISPLCLIHGLHSVSLSFQQLNLGAANAVQVMRAFKAKYWIGTHDEVKKGGGVVSWILKRVIPNAELGGEEWEKFVELGNGESRVLE